MIAKQSIFEKIKARFARTKKAPCMVVAGGLNGRSRANVIGAVGGGFGASPRCGAVAEL